MIYHLLIAKPEYETDPGNSSTHMHQAIDSIHLGQRQASVLIKPSAILIRYTFPILNVERNDSDFVFVAEKERQHTGVYTRS